MKGYYRCELACGHRKWRAAILPPAVTYCVRCARRVGVLAAQESERVPPTVGRAS